jgi:hypothetical protein
MPFPLVPQTNLADQPVMLLNLVSATQPMSMLSEYGEFKLAPRIPW